MRLSGGEQQRVAIARALYRRPSILLLDEATSALDREAEEMIVEAVGRLRGEVTIIVVAHRLGALAACDQILELEGGRVARTGDYQMLA